MTGGSRARRICELDLVWLAAISMNASEVHLNADRAAQGAYGRPIVLGALTAAIAHGISATLLDRDLGPLVGWEQITLHAPVFVDDEVSVEVRLDPHVGPVGQPQRVLTRAFVRDHELAAELVALYGASGQ